MTPPEATNVAAEVLKRWLPAAKRYDGREYFLVMEMLPFLDLTTGFDQMVVLVQTAKNGDPDADGLLHRLGGMFVSAGAPIPEPLRSYIAERLRYETNPKRSRRGKHPQANLLRDFAIVYLIARLSDHGFCETRNREQRVQESACSILAAALAKVGIHIAETGIEKIWEKRKRLPVPLLRYVTGKARIPTFSALDS